MATKRVKNLRWKGQEFTFFTCRLCRRWKGPGSFGNKKGQDLRWKGQEFTFFTCRLCRRWKGPGSFGPPLFSASVAILYQPQAFCSSIVCRPAEVAAPRHGQVLRNLGYQSASCSAGRVAVVEAAGCKTKRCRIATCSAGSRSRRCAESPGSGTCGCFCLESAA